MKKNKVSVRKIPRLCTMCDTIKDMEVNTRFCSRKCRKKATQIDSFDNEYKFYNPVKNR